MEPAREGPDHADGGDGEHRDAPNKAAGDGEHAELDHPVAGALGRVFFVLFGLEAGVAPPDPVCREGAQGPEDRRRRRHHHHRLISGRDGRDEGERRRHEEGDGHPEEGASPLLDVVLAPIAPPRHDGAEGGEDVLHCVHELADRALLVVPVLLRGLGVVGRRGRTPTGAARGGRRLGVGVGVAHVRVLLIVLRVGIGFSGCPGLDCCQSSSQPLVEFRGGVESFSANLLGGSRNIIFGGRTASRFLALLLCLIERLEVGAHCQGDTADQPVREAMVESSLQLLQLEVLEELQKKLQRIRSQTVRIQHEVVQRTNESGDIFFLEQDAHEIVDDLRPERIRKGVQGVIHPMRILPGVLLVLGPQGLSHGDHGQDAHGGAHARSPLSYWDSERV